MDSTQRAAPSDLLVAEWYLRPAHRVLWALPLFAALTIVIITAMLRSDAGDPVANLNRSMAALVALKPHHVGDAENAAIALRKAFGAQVRYTAPPNAPFNDGPEMHLSSPSSYYEDPGIVAFYQSNAPALQQVHAALALPGCDWDCDYRAAYGMLLPHLAPTRYTAKLLAGSARLKAHNKDHAGAAKDIQAMYRLAAFADQDACLVCGLVGVAIRTLADQAIESILAYDAPKTLKDLAHYQRALLVNREIIKRFRRAIECERDATLVTYDLLAQKKGSTLGLATLFPDSAFPIVYGAERGAVERIFGGYLKQLDTSGIPPSGTLTNLLDAEEGPTVLTRQLLPVLDKAGLNYLRSQEQGYLIQIALAVQAFKISKLRDPKSLNEVVPEFLPSIPTSVFKDAAFSIVCETAEVRSGDTVRAWCSGKPVLKVYSFGKDGFDNERYGTESYLGERVVRLIPEPGDAPQPLQEDGK